MSKLTDKRAYIGNVTGRYQSRDFEGAGMELPWIVRDLVGSPLAASPLNSASPTLADNARYVTQVVNSSYATSAAFVATITFTNNGTTTWTVADYQLRSRSVDGNVTWGFSTVALSGSVAPGASVTFTLNCTAPGSAATYNFQWRMYHIGSGYFGDDSALTGISITGGGGVVDNAAFVSQVGVPATMTCNQTVSVTLNFTNSGGTNWDPATGYRLRSQNPLNNTTWGMQNVGLGGVIAPGAPVAITWTITAPDTPGTYNFQWQISSSTFVVFGQASTNVSIVVSAATCATLPAIKGHWQATPGTSTYRYRYTVKYTDTDGSEKLLGVSPEYVISNGNPTCSGSYPMFLDLPSVATAPSYPQSWYEVYRTYNGAVSGNTTTGKKIGPKLTGNPAIGYQAVDTGWNCDGSNPPTCATYKSRYAQATVSGLVASNIISGVIVDGAHGGTLIGTTLLDFDFTNPNYPMNTDFWLTADVQRNIWAIASGGNVQIVVLGIDCWGRCVSDGPGTIYQNARGIGGVAFWKISHIYVLNPSAATLWLGWGANYGLKYPMKVRSGSIGNEQGYIAKMIIDGNGVDPELENNDIITAPLCWDGRGLFRPGATYSFNGASEYELWYEVDAYDNGMTNAVYNALVAAGTIPLYRSYP